MFEERQKTAFDDAAVFDLPVARPPHPEPTKPAYLGFQLPRRVWIGMLASYGVFFVAIAAATGGSGHARFAIVVSLLYTVMFFGLARVMARQAGAEQVSPVSQQQPLQTWCGPMEPKAVYGQVLVVPAAIAFFAVAVAVVHAVVV